MIRTIICASILTITLASSVLAQSEAELVDVFKGDWAIHHKTYGVDGNNCVIQLSADKDATGSYALSSTNCAMEMAGLTSWSLVGGQMALAAGPEIRATLGGNQTRMSGNSLIGAPIILDRVGSEAGKAVAEARKGADCYYIGFTTTCANDEQLKLPELNSDGVAPRINVIVNLNVRNEARDDAAVIGVVPAGSCVVANACVEAADGTWCRALFGDTQGWLKKLALRQETWPVLTYTNRCEAG